MEHSMQTATPADLKCSTGKINSVSDAPPATTNVRFVVRSVNSEDSDKQSCLPLCFVLCALPKSLCISERNENARIAAH